MTDTRGNLANGFASKQSSTAPLKRQDSVKSVHSLADGKKNPAHPFSVKSLSSGGSFDVGGLDVLDDQLDKLNFFPYEDGGDAEEEESAVEDDEVDSKKEEREQVQIPEDVEDRRGQRRIRPEPPPEVVEEEESVVWRVGRGVLACSIVGAVLLLMMSITLPVYLFVAWQLMPVPVNIMKPLYFDYRLPNPTATVYFLAPNVLGAARARLGTAKGSSWVGPRVLNQGQPFSVTLTMVLPESDTNAAIGMFQVTGELLSIHEDVIALASRPCMLRFRSVPVQWVRRFLLGLPLLAGVLEEDQRLTLRLMENRKEGSIPTAGIRLALGPKAGWPEGKGIPEIYEAVVTLEAVMTPAGILMRCFRLTGVIWGIGGLFLWELFWVLVCCRGVLFPNLQQTPEPRHQVPVAAPANHINGPQASAAREGRRTPPQKNKPPTPLMPRPQRKQNPPPAKSFKDMSAQELLEFLREDEAELLALLKEGGMKLQDLGGSVDGKPPLEDPDLPPLESIFDMNEAASVHQGGECPMATAFASTRGILHEPLSEHSKGLEEALAGHKESREESGANAAIGMDVGTLRGLRGVEMGKGLRGGDKEDATRRWVEEGAEQGQGEARNRGTRDGASPSGGGGSGSLVREGHIGSTGWGVEGLGGLVREGNVGTTGLGVASGHSGESLGRDTRVGGGSGGSGSEGVAGGRVQGAGSVLGLGGVGSSSSSGRGLKSGGGSGGESEWVGGEKDKKLVRKQGKRSPVLFEIEELELIEGGWEVVESEKWKGKRPLGGSPSASGGSGRRQRDVQLGTRGTVQAGLARGGLERVAGAGSERGAVGAMSCDDVVKSKGGKGAKRTGGGAVRGEEAKKLREPECDVTGRDCKEPSLWDSNRVAGQSVASWTERNKGGCESGGGRLGMPWESDGGGSPAGCSGDLFAGGRVRNPEGGVGMGGEGGPIRWTEMLSHVGELPLVTGGDEGYESGGREFVSVPSREEGLCTLDEDAVLSDVHDGGAIIRTCSSDGSLECFEDSPTAFETPDFDEVERGGRGEVPSRPREGPGVSEGEFFEDAMANLPGQQYGGSSSGQLASSSSVDDGDKEVGFLNAKFTFIGADETGGSDKVEQGEQQFASAPTLEVGGLVRVGGFKSLRKRLLRSRGAVGLACLL